MKSQVDVEYLREITDDLTRDPNLILTWQILDPATQNLDLKEAGRWSNVLRQAKAEQIRRSPPFKEYIKTGVAFGLTIAGFVVAALPVGVPEFIGMFAASGGAFWTVLSSADLVREDIVATNRIVALSEAERLLAQVIRRAKRVS